MSSIHGILNTSDPCYPHQVVICDPDTPRNISSVLMSMFFGVFKLQSVKFKLYFVGSCCCGCCQCSEGFYKFTHCWHFNCALIWKTSSVKHRCMWILYSLQFWMKVMTQINSLVSTNVEMLRSNVSVLCVILSLMPFMHNIVTRNWHGWHNSYELPVTEVTVPNVDCALWLSRVHFLGSSRSGSYELSLCHISEQNLFIFNRSFV